MRYIRNILRGLIQLTGKYNYERLTKDFGFDFINNPEELEKPRYASLSAGWFWHINSINSLAKDISDSSVIAITKVINGGTNGLHDRFKYFDRLNKILQA